MISEDRDQLFNDFTYSLDIMQIPLGRISYIRKRIEKMVKSREKKGKGMLGKAGKSIRHQHETW